LAPEEKKIDNFFFSKHWKSSGLYFSWFSFELGDIPPKWNFNYLNGIKYDGGLRKWWKIDDFNLNIGDIKTLWELSRFDWVLIFSIKSKSGDKASLKRLNEWISDWCKHNPSYFGVNWKCAQEASFRVIHLAISAKILNQKMMLNDLKILIIAHLKRIASSTSYASSQENNHITSEAAALYIGGLWCSENHIADGIHWKNEGRVLLEKNINKLIHTDGGFSQYSVNYHRLLLDTMCSVELLRLWFEDKPFRSCTYKKLKAATLWLYTMVNEENGNVPNLGANDGANLLPVSNHDYRDFRPSVQLSMVLFHSKIAYETGNGLNYFLKVNDIKLPLEKIKRVRYKNFNDSGISVMKNNDLSVFIKYPKYKFRPKHCDALHVDFWIGKINILRDCGTYKYNSHNEDNYNFSGVKYHNTIQFDGSEQMPSLGRFLRGGWLNSKNTYMNIKDRNKLIFGCSYTDWKGATHEREVQLYKNKLIIQDLISGFDELAILRWNLIKTNWILENNKIISKYCTIRVNSGMHMKSIELLKGWESLYYSKKDEINVLECSFFNSGKITTTINLI